MRYRHLEISHAAGSKPEDKDLKAIGATVPYSVSAKTIQSDGPLNFREILWTDGDDDDEGSFLGELATLRARWNLPAGLLPFARGEYGDSFALLDLRPESYGSVLALLADLQPLSGSRGEPVLIHLADSFDAYVDSLVPELSDEALGE